jgi:hypothetical protein
MNKVVQKSGPEHGGAGVKLLIAMSIIVLGGNAALNYVPVAYDAGNFKQEMDTTVVQALALPNSKMNPADVIKNRINKAAKEDNIPADMYLEVKPVGNIMQARVVYTKQVSILPFGAWDYAYHFDYTATPQGFLAKDQQK